MGVRDKVRGLQQSAGFRRREMDGVRDPVEHDRLPSERAGLLVAAHGASVDVFLASDFVGDHKRDLVKLLGPELDPFEDEGEHRTMRVGERSVSAFEARKFDTSYVDAQVAVRDRFDGPDVDVHTRVDSAAELVPVLSAGHQRVPMKLSSVFYAAVGFLGVHDDRVERLRQRDRVGAFDQHCGDVERVGVPRLVKVGK